MLTFYLVRHGTTEHNRNSITQGQIDSPLTKEGLKNAQNTSEKLRKIEFDQVYSSDLGRAFITAYIIVENLGIKSKISRARELREINYGIYSNTKKEVVEKNFPREEASRQYPEGESYNQVQDRAVKFLKHLERKHPDKTLLIVTHGGVIRAVKCYFLGWDFNDHLNMGIINEYIGKFVIEEGKMISYEEMHH
jgi:probable phosphoglycerate mutase